MLWNLADLDICAKMEDILARNHEHFKMKSDALQILARVHGREPERLIFAHFLNHYEKAKLKIGSVPLHILRLDVLKY